MPHEDDQPPNAIAAALRLIKESLFTFGADGDECIQRLVAVEARLANERLPDAQSEVFQAFFKGLSAWTDGDEAAPLASWKGAASLAPAYETGGRVARLNLASRKNSGLNIGPFDAPKVQAALTRAAQSLAD